MFSFEEAYKHDLNDEAFIYFSRTCVMEGNMTVSRKALVKQSAMAVLTEAGALCVTESTNLSCEMNGDNSLAEAWMKVGS